MVQLLLVSCSGTSYTREIASLDTVSRRLDSAEAEVSQWDTVRIGMMWRQIENDLRYVEVFYRHQPKDSIIDKRAATILSDYRSVRKPLRNSYAQVPKLKSDIDMAQAQINNLIHDLQKDLVDKKDAEQYVRTEKAEAEKVIQNVKYISILLKDVFPRYDEVSPLVRAYVDSLKAVESKRTEK
jgi:hypothetical protein